jgi:hypothetical protein
MIREKMHFKQQRQQQQQQHRIEKFLFQFSEEISDINVLFWSIRNTLLLLHAICLYSIESMGGVTTSKKLNVYSSLRQGIKRESGPYMENKYVLKG